MLYNKLLLMPTKPIALSIIFALEMFLHICAFILCREVANLHKIRYTK
jgi:hypothetical protein